MNELTKIKDLLESLSNEMVNVSFYLKNIELRENDTKEKEISIAAREKKASEVESSLTTTYKAVEEQKMRNEQERKELDAKSIKIQTEWVRMTEEKEKLFKQKEDAVKMDMQLAAREEELIKAKALLLENEKKVTIEKEGNQDLAVMLKIKQEKLEQDQKKVDKYLNSI